MSYGGSNEAVRLRRAIDERVIRAWRTGDDEGFSRALAESSIASAFRPRDESDVDVHPESLRGKILELYDA